MEEQVYTPEGMPEGIAGDTNTGTIDNLIVALGDAGKPYEPEGLPERYQGQSNPEMIDGLLHENAGYRDANSKIEKAPENIEGYAFEPAEAVKPYFPEVKEGETDSRLDIAREAALAVDMPPGMFQNFINGVYTGLAGNDAFPKPDQDLVVMDKVDSAAEFAAFGKGENLTGDDEISRRVDALTAYGKAYVAQNKLSEGAEVEVEVLAQTQGGLELLARMQKDLSEKGIQVGGDAQDAGGMTDDEFAALGGSPEIDPTSSQYKEESRLKYDAEMKRRYNAKKGDKQS